MQENYSVYKVPFLQKEEAYNFETVSYDTESDIYAIRDYSFIPLKTGLNKFQFKKAN